MGVLQTLVCPLPLCLILSGAAPPAAADTAAPLRSFAICAGRLSAVMEHQWLNDGPGSEVTARSRDAMLDLVEAVLPPEQAATALHWRIEAKAAQKALLTRATFTQDPIAARRSAELIEGCLGLIGQT